MELTEPQAKILKFVQQHIAAKGYPPTHREIADAMKYRSPNAAKEALAQIEAKGIIELTPGVARGIRIL